LLLNEIGNATECSSANIFCIVDNTVITPDLESGILPGVVRDVVIGLASNTGIPVEEKSIPLDMLLNAGEVFITSSLRGVMPVAQIDKISFTANRPVTKKLSALYSAELDAACCE
jgi:branched-chain amino acid aminotransferase